MNIGFDAKRAYHNSTGLGNYSRTLIASLALNYPQNNYYLFNPKPSSLYRFEPRNIQQVLPAGILSKMFPQLWRSSQVTNDIQKRQLSLYHGLSHEIPFGMPKTGIPSVVTIHDLIHKRYPQQFGAFNAMMYDKKSRYSCENADKIIAISQQTKSDIIEFYNTVPDKINVCYQSCNTAFAVPVNHEQKHFIRKKYGLPPQFYLYVGSIIQRKNLLSICKALRIIKSNKTIPLVVIGNGKRYKQQVKDYIAKNDLEKKVIFLSDEPSSISSASFISGADFPAIYQLATAMIYPSIFEGFGIPVLEALFAKLPVITSGVSSLPEAGGDAAYYIDPMEPEDIATAMQTISSDGQLSLRMQQKGWLYAQNFTPEKCATAVMDVYKICVK